MKDKEYYYRIKGFMKDPIGGNTWGYYNLDMGIIKAKDRNNARSIIESEHKRSFPMRSKKEDIGTKNPFLLTIFELDDHWRDYWTGERRCKNEKCQRSYTNLEYRQMEMRVYTGYCSKECYEVNSYTNDNGFGLSTIGNYIYKITNKKNGKCYIGQTTQAITLRWWQHITHNNTEKFGKALSKYPLTDWQFEAVEHVEGGGDLLSQRERFYIDRFDSVNNGYNTI